MTQYENHNDVLPALVQTAMLTSGPMLELGMGFCSTPVLGAIARNQKRQLLSADTDKGWVDRFRRFAGGNPFHQVRHIDNWDIDFEPSLGLALVAVQGHDLRVELCRLLRQKTDIIVLHDDFRWQKSSLKDDFNHLLELKSPFSDFVTVLLSDTIDVRDLGIYVPGV